MAASAANFLLSLIEEEEEGEEGDFNGVLVVVVAVLVVVTEEPDDARVYPCPPKTLRGLLIALACVLLLFGKRQSQ